MSSGTENNLKNQLSLIHSMNLRGFAEVTQKALQERKRKLSGQGPIHPHFIQASFTFLYIAY